MKTLLLILPIVLIINIAPRFKFLSAAHLAASKGQTESIMELEDLGGDIWLRNHRGDFPLHEAAQAGFIGTILDPHCTFPGICKD